MQPSRDLMKRAIYMQMARDISRLSTCSRRQVGCIITNAHGIIVGSGVNGVLAGQKHCDTANPGGDPDKCFCLHAEVNAIINSEIPTELRFGHGRIAYVTTFPCDSCMKLLAAFGVETVVYDTEYRYFESAKRVADYYGIRIIKMEDGSEISESQSNE